MGAVVVPADASPRVFAEASLSSNTIRAFRSDLRQFARWRAGFLHHEVSEPHDLEQVTTAPVDPAEVAALLKGIRRTQSVPVRRAKPMTLKALQTTLLKIDIADLQTGALGTRDQALLLFGFVGAFRESELTALTVGDLRRLKACDAESKAVLNMA